MTKKFLLTLNFIILLATLPVTIVKAQEAPELLPIQITELLADPSPQLDSEAEYIELHNPNQVPVDLNIYTLHSGSHSTTREFPMTGIILQPGEYRAFYSIQTGLNLVNSNTGQAWLVGPGFVRVSETPWYPANMGENKAWAFIGDSWQVTESLSPGAANVAPPTDPQTPTETPVSPDQTTEACPEGKFRNPETGRCKIIEQSAALAPCGSGQERNPATNRCRAISAAPTSLTPCDSGEERNPDTNRCRQTVTATSPSACQDGYERNPETNRCRKITAVKAASTNTPGGPDKPSRLNFILIGGVSTAIVAYGMYEYRKDITTVLARLKNYVKSVRK